VMSKDRRGMAVLLDALIFLTALSVLSAFIMVPSGTVVQEERDDMVRSFHSVMLAGEVPGDDGSALSRLSLAAFLVMVSQDHILALPELGRIGSAVNGTLAELEDMGHNAWWVLSFDGEEHVFGRPCDEAVVSLFVDHRELRDDGLLSCSLMIAD
jgi:hypothetical protein